MFQITKLKKMHRLFVKVKIILILTTISVSVLGQTVDPDLRFQTLEGWGTSLSWWANLVGNYPDSVINAVCDELTDSSELNMNVFRYNIHGGDNPVLHSGEAVNHFRWDSGLITSYKASDSSSYNWNANSSQRRILLELLERNENLILEAIAYSPPYWMTVSNCSAGAVDSDPNLDTAYTDDYADFLTDIVRYYHDSLSITFRTLTALNEPGSHHWHYGGIQEGCHIDTDQQKELIGYLHYELISKNMTGYCGISSPEAVGYNSTYSTLNNYEYGDSIFNKISQINSHGYFHEKRSGVSDHAYSRGMTLWQSEAGPLGVALSALENHLEMASRIIGDLRLANVNAWIDWQAVSTDARWGFYTYDTTNQVLEKSKNYYVRKQFSKYIKKDYQIIYVGHANAVAALSPNEEELVIVALNNGSSPENFSFDLSRFASVGSYAQTYRTSSVENFQQLSAVAISNDSLDYTAPANSITTFRVNVTTSTPGAGIADGLYRIKAKHSGKYMSVANASTSNGAIIEQEEDQPTENLKFEVRKEGLDYIIVPRYNNKLFTINGASSSNGAQLTQWENVGGDNQRFIIQSTDSSGYYKIINKNSNLLLAVENESTLNDADVVQWTDLNTDNFYWEFEPLTPTTLIAESNYFIRARHSGKYMSVAGQSTEDGAVIEQWSYVDQNNLKFEVTMDLSGYYELRPIYNTKKVTVDGASTSNGAAINIYTDLEAINQKFSIEPLEDGYYKIVPKYSSGKALAVNENDTINGADIVLWDYLPGYDNFEWEFLPVYVPAPLEEGSYYIKAVHSEKYMSVKGYSSADSALIEQWEYVDQDNLRFDLSKDSLGYYKISPVYNAKTLTIGGKSAANGTSVIQYTDNDESGQKFMIESLGDDQYRISPKYATGKALAVENNSYSNGADVVLWDFLSGYNNFKWEFESVSTSSRISEESHLAEESILFYPNPVSNYLLYQNPGENPLYIQILNLNGQCLRTYLFHDKEDKLDLKGIGEGVYIIRINDGEQITSEKILIK